jgi:hypothetical protein
MTDIFTLKSLACQAITKRKDDETLFDAYLTLFENYYCDRAISNMKDLKRCPNQEKGKAFELLCFQYLKVILNCSEVYLWNDIPTHLREQLSLCCGSNGRDMGIDIIAYRNGWYAVQCKYKKPNNKDPRGNVVSWSSISTFTALVNRSGPWAKHVIMTTGTSIRRAGGASNLDFSICHGSFRKLNLQQWYQLFDINSNSLSSTSSLATSLSTMSIDDVREARLRRFS